MNPLLSIHRAFEKQIATITPSISTAYEGVTFNPVVDVPYQRVQIVPFDTENPTIGDGYYREVGECQIFLCYPVNQGKGAVLTRAELTRTYFPRGITLFENGYEVNVFRTPRIAGTSIIGDRIVCPVFITYSVGVL